MAQKILLIDDEEIICRTLVKGLERHGYEVYMAKNGSDAVVLAEEEEFDLVISDIRMPGKNGVEVVRELADIFKTKGVKVPAIFITGYADEKLEKAAKELNPVAVIHKPFDYARFLECVENALKE